jgi:hypothetical protein
MCTAWTCNPGKLFLDTQVQTHERENQRDRLGVVGGCLRAECIDHVLQDERFAAATHGVDV